MATIVAAVGGGNWTAGGTWVGGIAPTAADDAQIPATAGAITIDAGSVCRSADFSTYTNTLTHTSGVTLTIGDATAGLSNIALKMVSGMTYSPSADTCAITFVSTSTTVQTVDFGGKTPGNVTFNGAGGKWAITTSFNTRSLATTTVSCAAGTLQFDGTSDNSGLSHSWGLFSSEGSTARTLTLGTVNLTLGSGAGTQVWSSNNNTSMTLSALSSTITFTGASVRPTNGNSGGFVDKTFGTLIFTGGGVISFDQFRASANKLYVTGTAAKTDGLRLRGGYNFVCNSELKLQGNSATNRLWVRVATSGSNADTLGLTATFTITGATISNCQAVDFRDVIFANGGSNVDFSGITNYSGNCGGNTISGGGTLSFTTPTTTTATGSSANWSTATWDVRVPLPQDDVVLSLTAGQTLTNDMPRRGKSTTVTTAMNLTESVASTIYGGLDLTNVSTFTHSAITTFEGRSAFTLTSNGKIFTSGIAISMISGTLNLGDAFISSGAANSFTLNNGTFNAVTFNVTTNLVSFNNGNTKAIGMGTATWTLNRSSGNVWTANSTLTTLTPSSSTILISDTGASSKTFAGAGLTYNNLQFYGTGAGAIIFTGANTFNSIKEEPSHLGTKTLTFPASTTTTISGDGTFGNGANIVTIKSSSAGTAATLNFTGSGLVNSDYLDITDINVTPTTTWYYGNNSSYHSGTGWNSGPAPSLSSSLMCRTSIGIGIRI